MKSISGKITIQETGKAINDITVGIYKPASGKKQKHPEIIISALTKGDGQFTMPIPEEIPSDALIGVFRSTNELPIRSHNFPKRGGEVALEVPADDLAKQSVTNKALMMKMESKPLFDRANPAKSFVNLTKDLKKNHIKAIELMAKPKFSHKFFIAPDKDKTPVIEKAVKEGTKKISENVAKIGGANVSLPKDIQLDDISGEIDVNEMPGTVKDLILDNLKKGPILRAPEKKCKTKYHFMSKVSSEDPSATNNGDNGSSSPTENNNDDVSNEPVDTDSDTAADTEVKTKEELLKRLQEIFEIEQGDVGFRPNEETLGKDLNTEIAGGPADATAYHDFHSLQIAFEEVWTSHVDRKAARMLGSAYQEAVRVLGDQAGDFDFSEFDDLEQALEQLKNAVGVRESASDSSIDNNNRPANNWTGPQNDKIEGRLERLLKGVEMALKEGYKFDIFAPESYNFGILVNYRQRWQPLSYQVGDLVGTIPLAPGQSQKVTKRNIRKYSRAETEARRSVSSRSFERTATNRADAEIVKKATSSTNFSMSASTSIEAGIELIDLNATRSTNFSYDQSRESSETKKHFHEAVRKASSEYRDEHSIEVSTTTETESYSETVTELSNPNNELSITYLYYELQRRYHVSEKLHSVQPVVLVALDVPSPEEIDEAWLLEHEWIIRRVLLDDIYVKSLDVLAEGLADSEIAAETMQAVLEGQSKLVKDLKMDVQVRKEAFESKKAELARLIGKTEDSDGAVEKVWEFFAGGEDEHEALKNKTDAARKALDWAESDLAALTNELRAAASSVQVAAKDYLKSVRDLQRRRLAVDRLRLHVKQNILYYMQAVWAHTPPDQLYFQLYDQEIFWPEPGGNPTVYRTETILEGLGEDGEPIEKEVIEYRFPKPKIINRRPLYEVADVDRILGYKGNYVILPLKESNTVTDIMMQPYRSDGNAIDPDKKFGSVNDMLDDYNCMKDLSDLKENFGNGPIANFENLKKNLADFIEKQEPEGEMIIVPTGQLFIEALPGKRPLLEDFKLDHRKYDAELAKQNVIAKKLENLRWAMRLSEGMRDDPDIDKNINIKSEGDSDINVDA